MTAFAPLLGLLAEVPDPRRGQGQLYKLPYVLLFAILAIVTGCNSYRGIVTFIDVHRDRLNAMFGLEWRCAPAHTAIRYILKGLDPADVEAVFRRHAALLVTLCRHERIVPRPRPRLRSVPQARNRGVSANQVAGDAAIAVQIVDSDNATVRIVTHAATLTLDRRHLLRAEPTDTRQLLLTELRATDLVGRDADLATLQAWLNAERPITVRCLTGPVGAGKTRVGIELCERADASGWTAGFLSTDELRRFHAAQSFAAWHWGERNILVVVDYAAASGEALRAWLEALARRPPRADVGKLRLLLLERHAARESGWWARLTEPGGLSGRGPFDLTDPSEPLTLPPLGAVADRRALLVQTIARAAALAGKPAPAIPPPGTVPDFDRRLANSGLETEPLFLLMAGTVAVEAGVAAAMALRRIELTEHIAAAEHHRLRRLSRGWGIESDDITDLFGHLAACVTLQAGCDLLALRALVKAEAAALGAAPERAVAVANRLAEALPRTGGGADPVRPGMIGEAMVVRALAWDGRPVNEQADIVERAWRRDEAAVASSVVRTVQDLASEQAEHPALAWLDHLVAHAATLGSRRVLAGVMPHRTLALRARAATIQRLLVDAVAAEPATADATASQASALDGLAFRLSELGRHEAAAKAAGQAVSLLSALAAQHAEVFDPDLALALGGLANRLSTLGRDKEALAHQEVALALLRRLEKRHPGTFLPDLASLLLNASSILSELGHFTEALDAATEAEALTRGLATAYPEAFQPGLATALNNLANRLSDVGRREAALRAADLAAALFDSLAAQRPDAFRPDLALALHTLANRLSALGRLEEAQAAAAQSVALYRDLAQQYPDAFGPDLARALNNLGNRLGELGHIDEGLAPAAEAVETYRSLAKRRPEVFQPLLVVALNNLAAWRNSLGRCEAALVPVTEAVTLGHALAAQRPETCRPYLAAALSTLATTLGGLQRHQEAVAAATKAVALRRPLAEANPELFRPPLAIALCTLATALRACGRPAEGLAAAEQAVALRRALAARYPEAFAPDLAMSLRLLADCLEDCKRLDDALAAGEDAIQQVGRLFTVRPSKRVQASLAQAVDAYRQRCQRAGLEPGIIELGPVIAPGSNASEGGKNDRDTGRVGRRTGGAAAGQGGGGGCQDRWQGRRRRWHQAARLAARQGDGARPRRPAGR